MVIEKKARNSNLHFDRKGVAFKKNYAQHELCKAGHDLVTSAFVHIQLRSGRDRLLINISCNFKLTNPKGLTGQADGIPNTPPDAKPRTL